MIGVVAEPRSMKVLVPIDGSDCSFRAVEFAIELVRRYEGELQVVHITDHAGEATEQMLERVKEALAEAGIDDHPEIVTDTRLSDPRYANRVGRDILELAEEGDYDHIVMGHHGAGRIGRAILGSAAETVVRATAFPVTIIP